MAEKLMYIWDNKELPADRDRAERRVAMAEGIGFQVVAVVNRRHSQYEHEEHLLELEDEVRECVGLWADLPNLDIGIDTSRLIGAAHDAGVNLLGHVRSDEQVAENLAIFIGTPSQTEVIQ